MHTCPDCAKEISRAAATECPHCGSQLGQAPPPEDGAGKTKRKRISGLRLANTSVLLILLLIYLFLLSNIGCVVTPFELVLLATIFLLMISIPILTLVALFMSVVEITNLRKSGRKFQDIIPPIAGLLLSLFIITFCGGFLCFISTMGCGSVRRDGCVNNLKQLGLVLTMYGYEQEDRYPPIDSVKNHFIFESDVLYPEYLSDAGIVACPSGSAYDPDNSFRLLSAEHHPGSSVGEVHPDCITDTSYVYLGWEVTTDEEAELFFEAYDRMSPDDYDKNILDPKDGSILFSHIEAGVDACYWPDPNKSEEENEAAMEAYYEARKGSSGKGSSEIPVMWDRPYTATDRLSHQNSEEEDSPGGYVLYLDGHVEFVEYGEKFPMTETMARLLEERPREFMPDCEE